MQAVDSRPPSGGHARVVAAPLAADDADRAGFYAWLGALLLAPPTAAVLDLLAASPSLDDVRDAPLAAAWQRLVVAARVVDPDDVADEHYALFGGGGKPRVDPYASRYRTGHLMDKPLAAVRADLRALGLAPGASATIPEDHLGALCEAMRALIAGTASTAPQPLAVQRRFFAAHLAPWHAACLDDLRTADGASFYARVADFAAAFLDVERAAFDMLDAPVEPIQ